MDDGFQRLLTMSEARPLSMRDQAALGAIRAPRRSQLWQLIRHFLERFFNHETASPDGDAKTRLVQVAFATGLPGLMVAVYLWPVYHPFRGWPPGHPSTGNAPAYWLQVNHHFFFVLYSFVAIGIITVFEWDMFFPDLLDMWVLKTLPIAEMRVFFARVAAIAIFVVGFVFDANVLALLVLPSAIDPPDLARFLLAHALSVAGSGLFAAALIVAFQAVLLSLLGERLFRRISLLIQSLTITALLMLLLMFPVFSGVVPALIQSNSRYAYFCPPFWFLGIYQSMMEGSVALPQFSRLAATGAIASITIMALAVFSYPLAYVRRVRQLVEGPGSRSTRSWITRPVDFFLHAVALRRPVGRAAFHFISQTVLRVPRYRVYLALYGGVGLSVLAASLLRFSVDHGVVRTRISEDGIRAALGITAFWVIAGLRMAFVSSGNRQGNWVFRIVHGRPENFAAAVQLSAAARKWVMMWAGALTLIVGVGLWTVSPGSMRTLAATAAQFLVGAAMCVLLTDILFLNITTVAFTGEPERGEPNLAFTVLKYFTFFPVVAALPSYVEPWMEMSLRHLIAAVVITAGSHIALRVRHRENLRQHCNLPGLEDDEEDFPMKLGLRY
jgi:hypothetical protein